MAERSARSELSETLRIATQKLREWEQEVEGSKREIFEYPSSKARAALLQYNAALKLARLGAELLTRTVANRAEGSLFGLTKRPMFESYTRGIWFEHVATEGKARGFLKRNQQDKDREWKTLKSESPPPNSLETMWNALEKKKLLEPTVRWMRNKKDWWNDSTHMNARSVLMGWSNENGRIIQNDEQVGGDLHALIEIGAQSAGYMHRIMGNQNAERIFHEGNQLRSRLSALAIPPGP